MTLLPYDNETGTTAALFSYNSETVTTTTMALFPYKNDTVTTPILKILLRDP